MKEILKRCQEETGCSMEDVERVVCVFLNSIADELTNEHVVDLGSDFGEFSVRLRESKYSANSPRTPKDAHYKVVFREGNRLKKRLKVTKPQ